MRFIHACRNGHLTYSDDPLVGQCRHLLFDSPKHPCRAEITNTYQLVEST